VPRHTRESVIQLLIDEGATLELATTIYDELAAVDMNAAEIRAWVMHPDDHHAIPAGEITIAGHPHLRKTAAVCLIEDGEADVLLAELRRFTSAPPEERRLARLFGGTMDDTSRLTGGDPARAATILAIADLLLKRLRKPIHVEEFAQTELSPGSYDRIVDRILRGEEAEVLAALQDGTIDVDALQRDDAMLLFYGW
jgi:hypothetical protein